MSVPEQDSRVLAVTVTEPVGPLPGPVTVKLMVTGCCALEGFGLVEVIVVELAARLTFSVAMPVVVPDAAAIAAVPAPVPVARPVPLIDATEGAEEDQVRPLTFALVPSV